MTPKQWADILAGIEDARERQVFLLAIADELPEDGAAQLRELALRRDGLCPQSISFSDDKPPYRHRHDWNSPEAAVGKPATEIDLAILRLLPDALPIPSSGVLLPPYYRIYPDCASAWKALLLLLETL